MNSLPSTTNPLHFGITPALLNWTQDNNKNIVPISHQFNDFYYSIVDGLAESKYVFIEHNNLPYRFHKFIHKPITVNSVDTFTIGELGFGTGLNLFVTWLLWKRIYTDHQLNTKHINNNSVSPQLHYISFEKFPLTKSDFIKALKPWKQNEPKLAPLIDEFLESYPPLLEGCHRLNFHTSHLTVDLWFGDAEENLSKLAISKPISNTTAGKVNAWYLDGFAPSCNESLWAENIFSQIQRLSENGTTVATYSCAGVVKRGLQNYGFDIAKVKGFNKKRHMLTAQMNHKEACDNYTNNNQPTDSISAPSNFKTITDIVKPPSATIVGAGISGLLSAWSLACRGVTVTIIDKLAPLAGASGNPRALLAPKMTPIHHVSEHLHSTGYLYSGRFYKNLGKGVFEPTTAMDLLVKANVTAEHINAYPKDFSHVLSDDTAEQLTGLKEQDLHENQYLPLAGLINPQALADRVLEHPLIDFEQCEVINIEENEQDVSIVDDKGHIKKCQNLIICTAHHSNKLDKRIFDFRKIRGQISWFSPSDELFKRLPKIPLKYNGYCAKFTPTESDDKQNAVTIGNPSFLLGASFVRNDLSNEIRDEEHQISLNKLTDAIPELKEVLSDVDIKNWQARVGIRAQTSDYHPLVGKVGDSNRIWTLSGMGSKGYAYAPICAELLADMMTGRIPPLSQDMIERLSPNRQRLQKAIQQTD